MYIEGKHKNLLNQRRERIFMKAKELKEIAREILLEKGIEEKFTLKQAKALIREASSGIIETSVWIPYEGRELAWGR
jgi:hypothetical protein